MKNIKHLFVVLILITLFLSSTVVASAMARPYASEDGAGTYIPLQPDFLTNGKINVPVVYDTNNTAVKTFFDDYYNGTYLTVLVQGTHTDYYPPLQQNPEFVGEDKKWTLTFMKLPDKFMTNSSAQFVYYGSEEYPELSAHPMSIIGSADNKSGVKLCTFNYDFSSRTFKYNSLTDWSHNNPYRFSYVLDSSKLSKAVSFYPNYSKFGTYNFDVVPYIANGSLAHYNWWIGYKRVTDGDTGTINPTPDTDDGNSSSSGDSGSSSGGSSSSGGDSGGGCQKPGIGGDGDLPDNPGHDTDRSWLYIHFYIMLDGVKTPFTGLDFLIENYIYYYGYVGDTFKMSYNNITYEKKQYATEYKSYCWSFPSKETERHVEVIYYPVNGGGGSSSSGSSSSGSSSSGGSSSGGGGTSSGGSGGSSRPTLKPFDPNINNSNFKPATSDPWGGNIFDGLPDPKPLNPFPDKVPTPPTVSDPFGGTSPPSVSNPFDGVTPPTVNDPFGGTSPPSVNDPFKPGIPPIVSDPFK